MVKPRPLEWMTDDDGSLAALNPYEGIPESADYATRYVVRGAAPGGFVVSGEYEDGESELGSFDDIEDAKAAAQADADQSAEVDEP
jgi:hypothetical protein